MEYSLSEISLNVCSDSPVARPDYRVRVSRVIDIVIASLALLFFLPLMILIAVAIALTDRGPVVFAHRRIGYGGQSFHCFKFRTMVTDSEARLQEHLRRDPLAYSEWALHRKLRDDPRITSIGNFLRKASFDELPQLFNVLRGEMSIVGPRPIVADEIVRYRAYFSYYIAVKPGITGFWQISGRNDVTYRRRVAMDVVYARNRSLLWDLRIMLTTIPAVMLTRGSY